MQRFVGTLGCSMAVLALVSCSSSPPATPGGAGGRGGTAGSSGGSGGAVGTAGAGGGQATGGTTGTGGSSGGVGGNAGAGGLGGGGSGGQNTDAGGDTSADAGDGWMPLFNGRDLTGWIPSPGMAALYAVDTVAGEPAIHVYPTQADQSNQYQLPASLRTTQSFSGYTFHAEYKWGTKRFAPRAQVDRDNGICFHICNDPAQVWPESIEFQLGSQAWPGDWVSGNIFMLINKTRAQWPNMMVASGQRVYSPTGTKISIGAPASYYKALAPSPNLNMGGAALSASPATEWNIVELTVHGSRDASYSVNGTVVNGLTDMECQVNGTWGPLDHGPIALQAEYAEIFFRNVKIKILPP